MKDVGLLLASIGMFLCGVLVGVDERAALMTSVGALAADNSALRKTSETLRRRCPARPRFDRAPLIKGTVV